MERPHEERLGDLPVITEHVLFDCHVSDCNAPGLHLFRAPTVHDGSGTYLRLPHRVTYKDLVAGDIVVAMGFTEQSGKVPETLDILQFWHVISVGDGVVRIMNNNIVGCAGDGEYVYDRLAGMVGADPSEGRPRG